MATLKERLGKAAFDPQTPMFRPGREDLAPPPPMPVPRRASRETSREVQLPGVGIPNVTSVDTSKLVPSSTDTKALDEHIARLDRDLTSLPAETPEQTKERRDSWGRLKEQALIAMGDERTRTGWLRVAEQVSNALLQYSAAREGLKRGVDLSGLKLSQTDWDKRLNSVLGSYADTLETLNRGEIAQEKELSEREKVRERLMELRERAAIKKEDTERRARERAEDISLREAARVANQKFQADMFRARDANDERRMLRQHALELEKIAARAESRGVPASQIRQEQQRAKDQARLVTFLDNLTEDAYESDNQRFKELSTVKELVAKNHPDQINEFNKLVNDEEYEAAASLLQKPAVPSGVRMRAPDGTIAVVPGDRVEFYKSRGATVVE